MSQQAVSADIIPNSAVGIVFPKNRRNRGKISEGILIRWLPHNFRSLKILHVGPLSNFKIQQ
jgi:hypothetical protein